MPSFGEWIGDVMGQFPMNFTDVKPDFMVQVKKYLKEESEIGILYYQSHYIEVAQGGVSNRIQLIVNLALFQEDFFHVFWGKKTNFFSN